ncbi:hypothetical protein FRC00_006499 [Tulasnella sp. 408]|nr:hypothetical protein FRC00_006499 [Tulasnella sp. 408]
MIYNRQYLRKLLNLAIENSMRIKSLDARVPVCSNPDLQKLLKAPTPLLETLRIDANVFTFDLGDTPRLDEFTLSEGMDIKNLSLVHVITPLGSPRLSNLMTLALRGASVPQSLELLLDVLSSSQRLEVLHILEKPQSTEEYRANALVVLPHLRELVFSDVPSIFGAAFLASVYTPSCLHAEVKDQIHPSIDQASAAVKVLDAAIWRPGNDQAAVLVGGAGSNAVPGTLSISIWPNWIEIENDKSFHERCELRFGRTDTSELAARLGTVLSQLPSSPAVHLHYTSKYPEERPPADLLPWSELLESLSVRGSRLCRSVLRQLSQSYVLPGTGRVDWICRRLSRIKLVYERYDEDTILDGEAVLSLVRHRWSGESGLAEATRIASFEIWCWRDHFPNLWSLGDEITRMLPCFELIDDD